MAFAQPVEEANSATSRAKGPGTVRSAVTLAGFGDTSSFPPSGWGVSEHRASFGFHLGEMLRGPREGHPEPPGAQRQAQPYGHPAHAPARTPSSRVPGTRHAHIASGFFKKFLFFNDSWHSTFFDNSVRGTAEWLDVCIIYEVTPPPTDPPPR